MQPDGQEADRVADRDLQQEPTIYFHVGLGKAASTFLQYAVFPKLQGKTGGKLQGKLRGIQYIQRTRYKQSPDIIRANPGERYLVSREFDQQLVRECEWFRDRLGAELAARVKPIIVLRRQDSWFASQYRRHIKNGSPLSFTEFIDVAADTGLWKREDGLFLPKLLFLEQCFVSKPQVYFYEDLRKDPVAWIQSMVGGMGVELDPKETRSDKVHASYSEHQLKVMRSVSRRLFKQPIAHGKTSWLARRGRLLACYGVLYGARLLPASFVSSDPLIAEEELERLRAWYAEDWAACRRFAGLTS